MQRKNIKMNAGVMTIELLVAFAILLINITGVMLLVHQGQSLALDNETSTEAQAIAQALTEKAQADGRFDFDLVNPIPPTSDGIYTKEVVVTAGEDDPDTDIDESLFIKKVVSLISWLIGGKTYTTELTTLITNPDAVAGGDTCNSVLEGDWTNPQKTEYEFGDDILNDTSSGFPITSIQTFNKKMYVTVNNTHGNNSETFFILDLSDHILTTSDVLGKLDNSPGTISEGLNAVAVDGENYAYVTNAYDSSPQACGENHNCAQLQVIDINPSGSLSVVRNVKINSFTTGNKLANGTSIYYKDGIVYLGLANATSGAEFYILDVGGGDQGGSPTDPRPESSLEIGAGVNAIFVKDNFAYVASPASQELKIYDVSTLTSPDLVGNFNSATGAGHGKSIALVGNKLYLGKTVPNAGNDFHILNNSSPASTLPELGGLNTSASINGVIIRDFLAFLITSNGEFQTWKIDDPNNITPYASPLILPPGSGGSLQGTATDCEGNYIYVGSKKSSSGMGGQDKGYISVITGG